MRTLLRHTLTGQYYQSLGKWTSRPDRAHDFRFVGRAVRFVRKIKSPNMEINFTFDDPQQATSLTLKELLGAS